MLSNASFEDPVQTTGGNHLGAAPAGWSVNTNNAASFNLVQDGPGAHDGSQYLDLTAGGTFVFQLFTLTSDSTVEFGAYFSPRDGGTGGGHAGIYNLDQTPVLDAPSVLVGQPYHWELSSGTTGTLAAGTYAFVAFVDDPANVDSAYVHATAVPEPAMLGLFGLAGLALLGRRR